MTDSFILPPPPPPLSPMCHRPSLGRQPSWHRTSNPASTPPPPPPESWVPGDEYIAAEELRGNHFNFTMDEEFAPPQPNYNQVTPEMWEEFRKFIKGGGVEGLTQKVVEEVGERLKNSDSDRSSSSTGSTRASSPSSDTTFSTSPTSYSHSFSSSPKLSPNQRDSFFPKPAKFPGSIPRGSSFPHTPPASPPQRPQGDGLSIVDRRWGELFDKDGKATKRLGQVLRGVANYLISQVAPTGSVVISPSKLAAFYREYAVENEPHCFSDVFRCREDEKEECRNISLLFEEFECDYHLVKTTPKVRPMVPALTPDGFVKWTIMAIYAYPDVEAKRLDRIMSKLPIDADGPLVDGKPERLPKQLSRHLLPEKADKTARKNFDLAIDEIFEDREYRLKKNTEKARKNTNDSSSPRTPSKNAGQDPPQHDSLESAPKPREEKKRSAKAVSFRRTPSKDSDSDRSPSPQATRPSVERAGRPYNLNHIVPPPGDRNQELNPSAKSPRRASVADFDPAESFSTSPPSPSISPFELHSGRGRSEKDSKDNKDSKDDKCYRYPSRVEDTIPRRMPGGSGDDMPRSRRRRSVVVTQDKAPGRHHSRRESSSTDYGGYTYNK
ncbi:hypothetical protein jhhlp_005526 [Lomentospora prolificans]|uniref:DUF7514 domain-containing protein n=1 Tax=Lomentospora prolificans TaxID=41688 RepID=A0A2N3N3B6_9PEZI|nr:hypothetical protein jhhlp_005526 [Lomentospora prolificans]